MKSVESDASLATIGDVRTNREAKNRQRKLAGAAVDGRRAGDFYETACIPKERVMAWLR